MKQLVDKYAAKIVEAGLAEPGAPLIGGLDADLVWSRDDAACGELEHVFNGLNINSLLLCRPAEPYRSIIEHLAARADGAVFPRDCETRTMMHDLPVIEAFTAEAIVGALKQRKSVIVPGHGVVTWGTVSPEQAFIFFSSVCFACFVKFFADYRTARRVGAVVPEQERVFQEAAALLDRFPEAPVLMSAPFESEEAVYRAVSEAGRLTVKYHLVDSFFGNVSYRYGDTMYISQTGSSLDELEGCIDPCPLDGSSCAGITASSEFTAHREIVLRSDVCAVLHGHPKFSVIMSMDCVRYDCPERGRCHIACPEKRHVADIPIVPGEVGTGPYGLCNTLPPAMVGHRGVIVYGHGLFTVARDDFNEAFGNLLAVEAMCRDLYFDGL
ncbi:MAG TPA: class II aldolase/adducin family protein [Candidatus Hydrogenedentes bacterium]|nr:class II aldolase/adducin family protein [Candidatus Hydrogenedentota bacterium]HPG70060.1 class II aldolase/adducin family protein [Candidatus Hydrogenedentota bacterium]